MSIYKSTQTAYSLQKKKNIPIWRLNINTMTVTHFDPDTLTEKSKTYNTNFIKYHLHYSDSRCSDRLRKLVNEGKIEQYLDDLEQCVADAIDRQMELWKQSDKEYQTAVLASDLQKSQGLESCLICMAREAIIECMVYT